MDNRRLVLASVLSLLVVLLWTYLMPSPAPVQPTAPTSLESAPGMDPLSDSSAEDGTAGESLFSDDGPELEPLADGAVEASAADSTTPSAAEEIAAESEESRTLESDSLIATLSNRGGQLVSLRLKNQLTAVGEPVEMIRGRGRDPYPFALTREGRVHPLNTALFTWLETGPIAGGGALESGVLDELRLRYRGEKGDAEKRFTLREDGMLGVEITVAGDRSWEVLLGPGLRDLEGKEKDSRYLQPMASYFDGEEKTSLTPGKQDQDTVVSANGLRWVALEDNYFLSAVIPVSGIRDVTVKPVLQRDEAIADKPRYLPVGTQLEETLSDEQLLLLGASSQRMELLSFFGSKRYDKLNELPNNLDETVRWGFFGVLARPLYWGLKWIYQEMVPNYGWAIILMTILIKLLFMPLTHKSQKSMQKMQELNPKVQAIRAKYKSRLKDKQGKPNMDAQRKMNEETMAVYKQAGVNPASGCFPMLLQLPVFFAFYKLLSVAVELRGAPWLGWIRDLSVPDPFWVLPALLLVSGVLLQKMTPAAADPMQRRMMQMMPIMFSVFAISFPSGLLLYWVTNNVLTMAQQWFLSKGREEPAVAAPAKQG